MLVGWERPLPDFVLERLERGLPVTVAIGVELWKDRSVWFDRHVTAAGRELHLVRDPWRDGYAIQEGTSYVAVDSLSGLADALARLRVVLPVDAGWCDGTSDYRVVVTTVVRPLTARDVGEVEEWLRGELGGAGSEVLGLPKGIFGIVRDLSGLGDRASHGSSPRFRMSVRPGGGVRVLVPGTERSAAAR